MNSSNFTTNHPVMYYSTVTSKILIPLLAYVSNAFVLAISFNKNVVKHQYKHFLVNLAFADISFSFWFGTAGAFFMLSSHVNPNLCALVAYLFVASTNWMVFSLPLMPFCRYMKMYHKVKYLQIFTKRGCLSICGFIILISLFHPMLLLVDGNLGLCRLGHLKICGVVFRKNTWLLTAVSVGVLLALTAFSSASYFSWKVHKKIKIMHANAITLNQKQRIKECRQLLKIGFLQTVIPICTALHFIAIEISKYFGFPLVQLDLMSSVLLLNASFYAAVSLCILKPYKSAMKVWFLGLKQCKFAFVPQPPAGDGQVELAVHNIPVQQ